MWIGIDPGKDGAVARISNDGAVEIWDTPLVNTTDSKGKKKRVYDPYALANLLREVTLDLERSKTLVTIELVNAGIFAGPIGSKMGSVSAFSFGEGFGLWQGVIAALGLRMSRVLPRAWKKDLMGGEPKTKEAVVPAASRLYPPVAPLLRGSRGGLEVGRADALMLAHFGRIRGSIESS